MGLLQWPKNTNSQLTLRVTSIQRSSNIIYASLYMKETNLIAAYGRVVGKGLFSNIKINPGTVLCKYNGEIISNEEYNQRVLEGRGGYAIQLTTNRILDCYKTSAEGNCKASYANSSVGLFKPSGVPCTPNCEIQIDGNLVFLVSKDDVDIIKEHDELLIDYGDQYEYDLNTESASSESNIPIGQSEQTPSSNELNLTLTPYSSDTLSILDNMDNNASSTTLSTPTVQSSPTRSRSEILRAWKTRLERDNYGIHSGELVRQQIKHGLPLVPRSMHQNSQSMIPFNSGVLNETEWLTNESTTSSATIVRRDVIKKRKIVIDDSN